MGLFELVRAAAPCVPGQPAHAAEPVTAQHTATAAGSAGHVCASGAQVPVLRGLQRMLEELAFGCQPGRAQDHNSRLIIEQARRPRRALPQRCHSTAPRCLSDLARRPQVPTLRASLLRQHSDWRALAEELKGRQFEGGRQQLSQRHLADLARGFDFLCDLQEEDTAQVLYWLVYCPVLSCAPSPQLAGSGAGSAPS